MFSTSFRVVGAVDFVSPSFPRVDLVDPKSQTAYLRVQILYAKSRISTIIYVDPNKKMMAKKYIKKNNNNEKWLIIGGGDDYNTGTNKILYLRTTNKNSHYSKNYISAWYSAFSRSVSGPKKLYGLGFFLSVSTLRKIHLVRLKRGGEKGKWPEIGLLKKPVNPPRI